MLRTILISSLLVILPTACDGDEVCGPEAGLATTVSAAVGNQTLTYEDWRASPNNDCGETGGPVSLTLEATQVGTNRGFTLCFPRPDKLSGLIDLTSTDLIQVIDVFADLEPDCLVSLDRTKSSSGSIDFSGVCSDGTDPAGFGMTMQLNIPVTLTCGADITETAMVISAPVAVTATAL